MIRVCSVKDNKMTEEVFFTTVIRFIPISVVFSQIL